MSHRVCVVQTSKGPGDLCVETSAEHRGRSMFGCLKVLQSKRHIAIWRDLLWVPSDQRRIRVRLGSRIGRGG